MSAPDDIQSQVLADLVQNFGWTRIGIIVDSSTYGLSNRMQTILTILSHETTFEAAICVVASSGRNGLQEFQTIATQQGWTILAYETFDVLSTAAELDARPLLLRIKETGSTHV